MDETMTSFAHQGHSKDTEFPSNGEAVSATAGQLTRCKGCLLFNSQLCFFAGGLLAAI